MKRIMIAMLVLLLAGSGLAADQKVEKDPAKSPAATGAQKDSGQKTAGKKATVQWPRPYKSSEEVSADSMVPFPTDI